MSAPVLPRRSFLSGLATLPMGGVSAITARHHGALAVDPVYDAIEKHKAAWLAFQDQCAKCLHIVHIPQDIEDATSLASDVETEARYDMHQAVPTSIAGLVAYVTYWSEFVGPETDNGLGQLNEIGWEAIPTIAEAMATLFPSGGVA